MRAVPGVREPMRAAFSQTAIPAVADSLEKKG